VLKKMMGEEKVNNISPIFQVARLEVTCGEMDAAENHLRTVVRLRREDLRANGWEDRPPSPGEYAEDTYEKAFRMNLSKARENLSALLSMRHEDAEAFQVCRAAIGLDMKRCICQFQPRGGTACHASKEADDVAPEVSSIARAGH
jgi:hypothetical protein